MNDTTDAKERVDDKCVCSHWRTGPIPNSGHLDTPPHICTVSLGDEWCPCMEFRQEPRWSPIEHLEGGEDLRHEHHPIEVGRSRRGRSVLTCECGHKIRLVPGGTVKSARWVAVMDSVR